MDAQHKFIHWGRCIACCYVLDRSIANVLQDCFDWKIKKMNKAQPSPKLKASCDFIFISTPYQDDVKDQ